tara:strand:- start:128 stop:1048 length:921 start_codon:yes stop_codon:yes gene_type:complete
VNITPQGLSKGIIDENSSQPRFNFSNIKEGKVFGKNIYTDNKGFRITKDKSKKKFSNEIKILDNYFFVGGSVTFGAGVNQSETFSGILDKKFKNLSIHNASVIGSDIENNFYIIKNKIDLSEAKKIFINLSLDDIINSDNVVNNQTEKGNDGGDFISKLKSNKFLILVNNFIKTKSVMYVWIKGSILDSEKRYYLFALKSYKNKNNINFFKKNLNLIKMFNNKNNKVNFIVIPYSFQISDRNCKKEDLSEKIIKKYLENMKFQYKSFKRIFCMDPKKDKIFLKYDPSHLSRYGHKIVSKHLIKEIN